LLQLTVQEQRIKKSNFFHYPRVSPGNHLLTKRPDDSGYEIVNFVTHRWFTRVTVDVQRNPQQNMTARQLKYVAKQQELEATQTMKTYGGTMRNHSKPRKVCPSGGEKPIAGSCWL